MRACYARIFTDEHGLARFEDLEVELVPGFAVPPAEPLHTAPFLASEGTFWVGGLRHGKAMRRTVRRAG